MVVIRRSNAVSCPISHFWTATSSSPWGRMGWSSHDEIPGRQPLAEVNPRPARFDGVLLPLPAMGLARVLADGEKNRRSGQSASMAKAVLSDGQRLLGWTTFSSGWRRISNSSRCLAGELVSGETIVTGDGINPPAIWRIAHKTSSPR